MSNIEAFVINATVGSSVLKCHVFRASEPVARGIRAVQFPHAPPPTNARPESLYFEEYVDIYIYIYTYLTA